MRRFLTLSLFIALVSTYAAAQQTSCLANTGSVVGSYTFIATELPFQGVGFTPPGTTTNATTIYSNTTIGKLLGNINTGQSFSSAAVLYFDGAGHITVASSP